MFAVMNKNQEPAMRNGFEKFKRECLTKRQKGRMQICLQQIGKGQSPSVRIFDDGRPDFIVIRTPENCAHEEFGDEFGDFDLVSRLHFEYWGVQGGRPECARGKSSLDWVACQLIHVKTGESSVALSFPDKNGSRCFAVITRGMASQITKLLSILKERSADLNTIDPRNLTWLIKNAPCILVLKDVSIPDLKLEVGQIVDLSEIP